MLTSHLLAPDEVGYILSPCIPGFRPCPSQQQERREDCSDWLRNLRSYRGTCPLPSMARWFQKARCCWYLCSGVTDDAFFRLCPCKSNRRDRGEQYFHPPPFPLRCLVFPFSCSPKPSLRRLSPRASPRALLIGRRGLRTPKLRSSVRSPPSCCPPS